MILHYKEYGEGQPLIILHGVFGSLNNWRTVSGKLATQCMVYAVDQRNHGASPHVAEMSYPAMAADLLEFMDRLGIASAAVLGHSMGGKTAMQFALNFPDRLDALIIVDIAPRPYATFHDGIVDTLCAIDLPRFSRREEIDGALATGIPDARVRQFLLTNLRRDDGGAFQWRLNLQAIRANRLHLLEAVTGPSPFRKPALFVRGGRSSYVPDADQPLIRSLFPRAEFRTIAEASHWVHADAPDAFSQIVLEFLSGNFLQNASP
jgi:pimeloyl-ACP methyl ester carboxylesterase